MKRDTTPARLKRLLNPRHIAVFGGAEAERVVRECDRIGFAGDVWPVHPHRRSVAGRRCVADVAALPTAPDAGFIAVRRELTIDIVGQLAARGAGGAICYASGFAEAGAEGRVLQQRLVAAAGSMALVGPNCYGALNYLDGAALWPDQHGGGRIERGVAILSQSGNIGVTLTMQQRSVPLAMLVSVGNNAALGMHDYIDVLADDPRISAIGLHIESIGDIAAFSVAALKALRNGVPVVALRTGVTDTAARITLSHTSALAGADQLYNALFERLGVARVASVPAFLETLKLLSIIGPLPGHRLATISCSGGEAALAADRGAYYGLEFAPLTESQTVRLAAVLGPQVALDNPLDYHTYIWGQRAAQQACFAAMLDGAADITLKILDFPQPVRCQPAEWQVTVDAFVGAVHATGRRAAVVATLAETLPETVRDDLAAHGVAPMQGLEECLQAIAGAARIGAAMTVAGEPVQGPAAIAGVECNVDEWHSKQRLAAFGVPVPEARLVSPAAAPAVAAELGWPVVLKAVSADIVHKTETGAVRVNLQSVTAVRQAAVAMQSLSDQLLVERMVPTPVAELIVGVTHDPLFGPVLVIGSGGVWVELAHDSQSLLFPVQRLDIEHALARLGVWRLLGGYRSQPAGDVGAAVDAIAAVCRFAEQHAATLLELDINPLFVLPHGVVAVDAFIRERRVAAPQLELYQESIA